MTALISSRATGRLQQTWINEANNVSLHTGAERKKL